MLEQTNVQVKAGSSFQKICPFPVGYIYQSYTNTSPATIYGGTWTPITGRFLYCNNSTATGGSNTHTITKDEMPEHSHQLTMQKSGGNYGLIVEGYFAGESVIARGTLSTLNSGGGAPYNNMPAYQSCYTWRRTA